MAKTAVEETFVVQRLVDGRNYAFFVVQGRPAAVAEAERGSPFGAAKGEVLGVIGRERVRQFLEGRSLADVAGSVCGTGNPVLHLVGAWIAVARTV